MRFWLCAAALFALTQPVAAYEPEPTNPENGTASPESGSSACELHVWPSGAVRSTYDGWFHGGLIDGAVQGRKGYRKLPDSLLPTAEQVRTLGELDLPALLQLPGYITVLHNEALPSRVIRTTPGRIRRDTVPCYAELIVDDVFYQEHVLHKKMVKSIIRFRQFDGTDTPSRTFGSFAEHALEQFPVKQAEQVDAAIEEFRLGFAQTVGNFAKAFGTPAKKKRR
jgi:hypothetical protein